MSKKPFNIANYQIIVSEEQVHCHIIQQITFYYQLYIFYSFFLHSFFNKIILNHILMSQRQTIIIFVQYLFNTFSIVIVLI